MNEISSKISEHLAEHIPNEITRQDLTANLIKIMHENIKVSEMYNSRLCKLMAYVEEMQVEQEKYFKQERTKTQQLLCMKMEARVREMINRLKQAGYKTDNFKDNSVQNKIWQDQ